MKLNVSNFTTEYIIQFNTLSGAQNIDGAWNIVYTLKF